MVRSGQNFRCGFYEVPPKDRLKAIKNAGFDDTMFWWGNDFADTGDIRKLYDNAIGVGLGVHTVHFPSLNADWLWYGDERGKNHTDAIIQALKECAERKIENLVLHLTRRLITPPPNEIGAENFRKIIDAAEEFDVNIALENTRFLKYNDYILQRIRSPKIGFCFDSGHANCYTPQEDPLEKYGKMLTTTHIHDNYGPVGDEYDLHHIMGEGNVDFVKVFAKLKEYGVQYLNLESYCNESSIYYGKIGLDEYLEMSYTRLKDTAKKVGL